MKKVLIIIGAITFVILIGVIAHKYSVRDIITVNLNEEIVLKKNETVKLENDDVYLTIKRFFYAPPQDGMITIWSGLAVIYELKIDGKTYETDEMGILRNQNDIPYRISIVDTDYKTYAKVKIIENTEN